MIAITLTELFDTIAKIFNTELLTIRDTPVTLASIFTFFLVFLVLTFISRYVARLLGSRVLTKMGVADSTAYTFRRITYYVLVILSAIFSFQFIGIDLGGLAVIFGLLSVGIGFGLQNVTANFIAGIILLIEKPIKVGDFVTVGETLGLVRAINMRSTTIRSLHNVSVIVPNSEFTSQRVINWSHQDPIVRLDIDVGVHYDSDLDIVFKSLLDAARACEDVLDNPKAEVMHMGFGDSAWNMRLWVWIDKPKEQFRIRSAINCEIVRQFRAVGVEIPYPQRDLHVRSGLKEAIGKEKD